MEFNDSTILNTFMSLTLYFETYFETHIVLFNTATAKIKEALKNEKNKRYKKPRKMSDPKSPYSNAEIIALTKEWFLQFILVNQSAHLLYSGTATEDDEKLFFLDNFGTNDDDFNSISHPQAKFSYGKESRDGFQKKEGLNDKEMNEFSLCCFCASFFTDDLQFDDDAISCQSKSCPSLIYFPKINFNIEDFLLKAHSLAKKLSDCISKIQRFFYEVHLLLIDLYETDIVDYVNFNDNFDVDDLFCSVYRLEKIKLFPSLIENGKVSQEQFLSRGKITRIFLKETNISYLSRYFDKNVEEIMIQNKMIQNEKIKNREEINAQIKQQKELKKLESYNYEPNSLKSKSKRNNKEEETKISSLQKKNIRRKQGIKTINEHQQKTEEKKTEEDVCLPTSNNNTQNDNMKNDNSSYQHILNSLDEIDLNSSSRIVGGVESKSNNNNIENEDENDDEDNIENNSNNLKDGNEDNNIEIEDENDDEDIIENDSNNFKDDDEEEEEEEDGKNEFTSNSSQNLITGISKKRKRSKNLDDDDYDNVNDDDENSIEAKSGNTSKKKTKSYYFNQALISKFTYDKDFSNKLLNIAGKLADFDNTFSNYVYHKIMTSFKDSILRENATELLKNDDLWTEIVLDIKKELIDNSDVPLIEKRASKKQNLTEEEQAVKDSVSLLNKTRRNQKRKIVKIVSDTIKKSLSAIMNLFDSYKQNGVDFLCCSAFYNSFECNGNIQPPSTILKQKLRKKKDFNDLITVQMKSVKDTFGKKEKKPKQDLIISEKLNNNTNLLEMLHPINTNSIISSSTTAFNNSFGNTPSVVSSSAAAVNSFGITPFNNNSSIISSSTTAGNFDSFGNTTTISSSDLISPIPPLVDDSIANSSAVHDEEENLLSLSLKVDNNPIVVTETKTILNSNNIEEKILSSGNINLIKDFVDPDSNINNKTSNDIFYSDLLNVIFGSGDKIQGESENMKISFNHPKKLYFNDGPKYIEELIQLINIYCMDNITKKKKSELISDSISNLPLFHLLFKVTVCQTVIEEKNNPYTLYYEIDSLYPTGGFISLLDQLSNQKNKTVMETKAINLFKCVQLFVNLRRSDKLLLRKFPDAFPMDLHGTPSCFSILPHLLFQECNNEHEEENSTQQFVNKEPNTEIWGILSHYKLMSQEQKFPSILLLSMSKLHNLFNEDVTDTKDNVFFFWLKNGNFKSFKNNKLYLEYKNCFINFLQHLDQQIIDNMLIFKNCNNGLNFIQKYEKKISDHERDKTIKFDEDESSEDDNKANAKMNSFSSLSSTKNMYLNMSIAFKNLNPFFVCFQFLDNETINENRSNILIEWLYYIASDTTKENNKRWQGNCKLFFSMMYTPLSIQLQHSSSGNDKNDVYDRLFVNKAWLNTDSIYFSIDLLLLKKTQSPNCEFLLLMDAEITYLQYYNNIGDINSFQMVMENRKKKSKNCFLKKKLMCKYQNILSKNFWLIPLNKNNNHWCLFIVLWPNKILEDKCRILILDSLEANCGLTILEENHVLRVKLMISELFCFVQHNKIYTSTQISEIFHKIKVSKLSKVPQQKDDYSCGWFCILYALYAEENAQLLLKVEDDKDTIFMNMFGKNATNRKFYEEQIENLRQKIKNIVRIEMHRIMN